MSVLAPAVATVPEAPSIEERLVDAAVRCVSRWGMAKTTLDDVAREAGCSRATVYRAIPGGKDGLVETVVRVESCRFFAAMAERLHAVADQGLEELLVTGMSEAGRRFADHPALQYLLVHEPEAVVSRLAFGEMERVLRMATAFATPWVARYLPAEQASRVAEWAARILLSYASCPSEGVNLGDEASVRRLVRTFILPGLGTSVLPGTNDASPRPGATPPEGEL